jgi:hypothetical protein
MEVGEVERILMEIMQGDGSNRQTPSALEKFQINLLNIIQMKKKKAQYVIQLLKLLDPLINSYIYRSNFSFPFNLICN